MSTDILRRHQKVQCAHTYLTRKTIIMPDGTLVRFPNDVSDDQVRSLILEKFPDAAKTPADLDVSKLSNEERSAPLETIRSRANARKAGIFAPDDLIPAYRFFVADTGILTLKKIGCFVSRWEDASDETVTYWEARNVYGALLGSVGKLLGIGLASTLAVSLAVYAFVRAIGWVIGGFAAS